MKFIPYGDHFIDKKDAKAIIDSLKKPILTRGPEVEKFENNIAKEVGAKYAVAVSSCTAGLHLAIMCLKKDKRKKVITTPISFVSTSNTILLNGLKPVFVDINKDTLNIDFESLKKKTQKTKGIKAIIPVHLTGLAGESKKIYNFSKKKNITLIEDAAHSFGGTYDCGTKIGSCKYSDMTVFSFHPVKSITTLEGGVITTNSKKYYEKLCILRNHGVEKKSFHSSWFYEVSNIGLNYRISDVQCALGNSQLKKLKIIMNKRKKIAKKYDKDFSSLKNLIIPCYKKREISANHLYVIKIDFKSLGLSRTSFCNLLFKEKIGTQLHYIPIPLHNIYKKMRYSLNDLPNAKDYYDKAISIPIFAKLSFDNQNKIISNIKKILNRDIISN
jgi:UDP-4-amino-4,6-dideoxy-L-N-acetyl-beta-L-altrosamine transaminase